MEKERGYIISTKFVLTWKHRLEQGGWFRRARLVARQFKSSVNIEQTFAPTSMLVVPKMLIHLLLNVCRDFVAMTLDIKDAFLMADQPKEEKAYVDVDNVIYKLVKCLPGQRTAASQWFQLFAKAARDFGLEQDVMQPTLFMKTKDIYITVHVDDVFMVGKEKSLRAFVNYLKEEMKWSVEEKGPFRSGETFHYLKREFVMYDDWCDIRCDYRQYESLAKDVEDIFKKACRKTPTNQEFSKKDDSEELQGEDITRYRSVVGRLMYLAGERPGAQFAIQSLAKFMARPTKQAWKNAWHVCSYLQGTQGFGVRLAARAKGQTIMDVRELDEVESKKKHLLEVVCDSDYAGNRHDRKSTTSFQILLDGNLMESRVRSQKSISLSSGEAEFVAMVGGCSDGMLIRHLWMKMVEEECEMRVRSDSSAARSMVQRQGIGRVRHLDAALLWIQQKEKEKVLSVSPIPMDLKCADIGTKNLAKKRLLGLLYMLKMVNAVYDRIGEEEYEEIERTYQIKQSHKQTGNKKALRVCLLLLLANIEKASGASTESHAGESHFGWSWMVFCMCALLGVLSICAWLRDFIIVFVKGGIAHLMDIEKVTIQNTENEVRMILERKDQATQATCLEDNSLQKKMDEEVAEMQAEYVKQDMYIEQLEERVRELEQHAAENFQMYELRANTLGS